MAAHFKIYCANFWQAVLHAVLVSLQVIRHQRKVCREYNVFEFFLTLNPLHNCISPVHNLPSKCFANAKGSFIRGQLILEGAPF